MITVVIADRMGKGQNVAKGVEAAGGKAVVVPSEWGQICVWAM